MRFDEIFLTKKEIFLTNSADIYIFSPFAETTLKMHCDTSTEHVWTTGLSERIGMPDSSRVDNLAEENPEAKSETNTEQISMPDVGDTDKSFNKNLKYQIVLRSALSQQTEF